MFSRHPLAGITLKMYTIKNLYVAKIPSFLVTFQQRTRDYARKKISLLNFEVFHSKWVVVVDMVFDLSYCYCYPFRMERARKMQFLPLQRKIKVDIVPSKFEQNR